MPTRYLTEDPESAKGEIFRGLQNQLNRIAVKKQTEELRKKEQADKIRQTIIEGYAGGKMRPREGATFGDIPDTENVGDVLGYLGKNLEPRNQDYETLKELGIFGTGQVDSSGIADKKSILGGGRFTPEQVSIGGLTLKREPAEEEIRRDIQRKATEQAVTAAEKEKQLNISKVSRLGNISDVIEEKFKGTSPYTGGITKTGLMPILGVIDVVKSDLQATEAQRNDLAYRKFVKGMRAQLARAMGDVGNLSEPEQKAAMELVPTLMDSKETGIKKLDNLRDFISQLKKTQFQQPMFTGKSTSQSQYQIGQTINKGGKTYQVTGFDTDGEPLVDEVR